MLRGKTAVVTGASSGIGRAIVQAFAEAGATVYAMARRRQRLAEVASETVIPVPVDLRDPVAIRSAFEAVPRCDILVNNAGLGYAAASLIDGDRDKWREMVDVNVLALCHCTDEAIRKMRSQQTPGHVVHIASMSSHRVPNYGGGMYSATKFAVRALTEALRKEIYALKLPIRVTAISPGFVETEFASVYHGSEERGRETYSNYPVLQPQDIAATVLHAINAPDHVAIHDVLMRPLRQEN
ncbi:MAG: SDR family NAD(P)-dependent oxidoreductase [Myxococcota bacterium]